MTNIKILLVDDRRGNQLIIKARIQDEEDLQKYDWHYDAADMAKSAVEKARNQVFDIVVLDGNMPAINGPEIIEELLQTNPKMCIIMFSDDEQRLAEAAQKGVALHSKKDFDHLMKILLGQCEVIAQQQSTSV